MNWNTKFEWLANFDRGMTYLMNTHKVHCSGPAESLWIDNEKKLLIFARGGLLYAFNLHPTWSQESVFINCRVTGAGGYRVIFSTDDWLEALEWFCDYYNGQYLLSRGHGIRLWDQTVSSLPERSDSEKSDMVSVPWQDHHGKTG